MRRERAGHWANRDFHDEVPTRRALLERGAAAAIVAVATFLVFLAAIQHESTACRDACYDGGLRSYEPGHARTAYEGSWQWQAQWGIGVGALTLGLAALAATTRFRLRRWGRWLLAAAVALGLAWIAWRLLEPPIPT